LARFLGRGRVLAEIAANSRFAEAERGGGASSSDAGTKLVR
jgi:hypothetical protein